MEDVNILLKTADLASLFQLHDEFIDAVATGTEQLREL